MHLNCHLSFKNYFFFSQVMSHLCIVMHNRLFCITLDFSVAFGKERSKLSSLFYFPPFSLKIAEWYTI